MLGGASAGNHDGKYLIIFCTNYLQYKLYTYLKILIIVR